MIETEEKKFDEIIKGIVVDLNNVLLFDRDINGKAKIENLYNIESKLKSLGYEIIIFISGPSLRRKVDSEERYEEFISSGIIYQAPPNSDTDIYILKYAKSNEYDILSNDCYCKYQKQFGKKWIKEHRKEFMLINGQLLMD